MLYPEGEPHSMPQNLITSDPKIMMGKPTITGTRITVELILEKLDRDPGPGDRRLTHHDFWVG